MVIADLPPFDGSARPLLSIGRASRARIRPVGQKLGGHVRRTHAVGGPHVDKDVRVRRKVYAY